MKYNLIDGWVFGRRMNDVFWDWNGDRDCLLYCTFPHHFIYFIIIIFYVYLYICVLFDWKYVDQSTILFSGSHISSLLFSIFFFLGLAGPTTSYPTPTFSIPFYLPFFFFSFFTPTPPPFSSLIQPNSIFYPP